MPSFNAHYLFAEHELDFIKKTFPEVKVDEGTLWYAAQGPDLFFFARLLPWMKGKNPMDVGDIYHEEVNPTQMLTVMRKYIRENPDDHLAITVMIGIICHYVLDRNAHPFVYAIEEEIYNDSPKSWDRMWIHNIIEHNFDTYLLQKMKGLKKANKFASYRILPKDEEVYKAGDRVFSYLTPRLTKIDLDKEYPHAGYNGMRDTRVIMKLLNDPHGFEQHALGGAIDLFVKKKQGPVGKCFFVYPEPMTDYDYFNLEHKELVEPRNPEFHTTDSLDDIMEKAYKDLERILTKFKASLTDDDYDMYSITEDQSFDTTLKIPRCEEPLIMDY
ncbi:MAG: hypothetical protein IJI67_05065 [Clostridia bacterium]|nr:hypothetical protein [Clostridia bacterium]